LLCAGCSHKGAKAEFFQDAALSQVWPPPPEKSRVRLLKVFTGTEEFADSKSAFRTIFQAITGENPQPVGFMTPAGIVSDGDRYIYVADPSARLVHKIDIIDNDITYLTHSGSEPFASPVGVSLDSSGNCYVSDSVKAKVYKFSQDGEYLGILGNGSVEFQRPAGLAIGRNDHKYVADVLLNKILIFDDKDRFVRDFPHEDHAKDLNKPVNVAVDPAGSVYVTDAFNFAVKVFDQSGNLVRTIGMAGDGPGAFSRPKGVALDSESHLYIIDANFDNYQIFNQEGRLLLYVGSTGKKPGQFFMPNGIFIDSEDRIYISDSYNQRIQVFQYLKEQKSK
jgi:sugar lactone lactonase YvrE